MEESYTCTLFLGYYGYNDQLECTILQLEDTLLSMYQSILCVVNVAVNKISSIDTL